MTWDIKMDTTTGDWVYTGHRDLMQSDGEEHIYQRIITRLKIPRGEYVYDELGNLGSMLAEATRGKVTHVLPELPTIIQEALEPMPDVRVNDVQVDYDPANPSSIRASISYNSIALEGEGAVDVGETPGEIFIANIGL